MFVCESLAASSVMTFGQCLETEIENCPGQDARAGEIAVGGTRGVARCLAVQQLVAEHPSPLVEDRLARNVETRRCAAGRAVHADLHDP